MTLRSETFDQRFDVETRDGSYGLVVRATWTAGPYDDVQIHSAELVWAVKKGALGVLSDLYGTNWTSMLMPHETSDLRAQVLDFARARFQHEVAS